MRPRRGTPWKDGASPVQGVAGVFCFNAATEGNSVESPRTSRTSPHFLAAGFNAATEGNSVERIGDPDGPGSDAVGLQCGHGGELRGKAMLDRPASPGWWIASMRPRRGTPWKEYKGRQLVERLNLGFNAATEGNSVERVEPDFNLVPGTVLQCGHGGELRGKILENGSNSGQ
jgi:hypothetical protein